MRLRFLESAARTALAISILALVVRGDPPPDRRVVMESTPGTADASSLLPAPDEAIPSGPTEAPTEEVPSGPPTWIEAPAIGLYAPVVQVGYTVTSVDGEEMVEWEVPDEAAGFHEGSAYPGRPGNTVISGHNNIGTQVFRNLDELQVGDEVILYVGVQPFRYEVVHKEIVREYGATEEERRENGRWIGPTQDERLTLVTCWPYTGNSHRLIVVAMPAP
ncbi:MAG: sortase [Anaerolineae bacterium]|nr:sortase [Anaerolineae bacterium]